MNRLNRKIEYALMALKNLSDKPVGELTNVNEVCNQTGAPFDATSRVMQIMVQEGILKSEHGARGGYALIKSLDDVSFEELLHAILGPVEIVKCANGSVDCDLFHKCNVKSPLNLLNLKLRDFYKSLKVSDLLQTNRVEEPQSECIQ